ncbi:MAG TPA: NrfD/PsrC family molybdoenzyme membrane anchor subunit [Acidimicrobiales bacterium]|nr:NrfD/PsrC family molybdoenzyme membrane anchor subunit [Acidimicrobiales bacterium]
MVPPAEPRSYYGRPILKKPVWEWFIPAYFFSGGLAGASSALAFGARLTGRTRLARRARLTSLAAVSASTYFLVADLGRPERFVNMLRVAKPTSPMSVGSWILAGFGPASGVAAATDVLGILPGVGAVAEAGAAILSPALTTYTGVLVANTAIPAWHEARHELPWLFAAGSAASAGGIVAALAPPQEAGPARRMAVAGAAAELIAADRMERQSGEWGEVYREGRAGRYSCLSRWCTGVGALVMLLLGRRRPGAVVGGTLVAVGAAFQRFAVAAAGEQSAEDPRHVVGPQRARVSAPS